jgi:hypothetical protein
MAKDIPASSRKFVNSPPPIANLSPSRPVYAIVIIRHPSLSHIGAPRRAHQYIYHTRFLFVKRKLHRVTTIIYKAGADGSGAISRSNTPSAFISDLPVSRSARSPSTAVDDLAVQDRKRSAHTGSYDAEEGSDLERVESRSVLVRVGAECRTDSGAEESSHHGVVVVTVF